MANTYLTCNVGSPNQQKFTWSFWVKKGKLGVEQHLAGNYVDGNNRTHLFFSSGDKLDFYSEVGGSNVIRYTTNRLFRDTNAWYHIVCAVDTTQAGGNRIRFYVNGEEETSFSPETECNQNTNLSINGSHYIGTYGGNAGNASYTFNGSISHLHFVDGLQLTPSSFGSTDSATGEWKINTGPAVTYGSSGYFILKDGNIITDSSTNSNNFSLGGGTLTKTEDNPSNVFATMNPLGTYDGTLENGNTRVRTNQTNYRYIASTLGVDKGKYYWECKLQEIGNYMLSGITDQPSFPASGVVMLGNGTYDCSVYTGDQSANGGNGHLYHSSTSNDNNTNTPGAFMAAFAQGDVLTFALDLDSSTKKLYFGANGQWANGSGATNQTFGNSTGVSIVIPQNTNTGHYFPACGDYSGNSGHWEYNFGNGYFGTTAVSSAGANASNIGIFEYDVPAGYTALSTKGINSF